MNLQNIHNNFQTIYLFSRLDDGALDIKKVEDYLFSWYELCQSGEYLSYDGKHLKKFYSDKFWEAKKQASSSAYESDIKLCKKYLINNVDNIEKSKTKIMVYDSEQLCSKLPQPLKNQSALEKLSCFTIWNNYTDEYKQWFLGDYKEKTAEFDMLYDIAKYIKEHSPDVILAHNQEFYDWPWLYYKLNDFPKLISPVGLDRFGQRNEYHNTFIQYPIGISIVDTIAWFKKLTLNKEPSYALDALMQKHLGYGKKYKKPDFSKLSDEIRGRNLEDVKGLVALMDKFKLVDYFDNLRRFTHSEWEDLDSSMRMIESLVFKEAKKKGIVLPNKPARS